MCIHWRSRLQHATLVRGTLVRIREQLLHSVVVEEDPTEYGDMPDIVTGTAVIKETREPPFGDLRGIDQGAGKIDEQALEHGSVKVDAPLEAPSVTELGEGREARHRQEAVEGNAGPGHVSAVKGRMPGQDDAGNAKGQGQQDVSPTGEGLAVKGSVLGGDDGGGDQERDACVVDAGKALHEGLAGYAVHGVPDGAADQALAGGEEEHSCYHDVRSRAVAEVGVEGVEVEGDCQDDKRADEVRPDVEQFVGE